MFDIQTAFSAGLPVAYLVLQLAALSYLDGRWQRAAVASALSMAAALALFVVGIALSQPAAALALSLGLPLATLFLLGLWVVYGVDRLRRQD